jgi:hypothetical protein
LSASEAPNPGRHHLGAPGDIISECPGDFVGIRNQHNLKLGRHSELVEQRLVVGKDIPAIAVTFSFCDELARKRFYLA